SPWFTVQIAVGVNAIGPGSTPTGTTNVGLPVRGSSRTRLFGMTCGVAAAELERVTAAAADAARIATAASASCQRRGRHRRRGALSSTPTVGVGVGVAVLGGSPFTAA